MFSPSTHGSIGNASNGDFFNQNAAHVEPTYVQLHAQAQVDEGLVDRPNGDPVRQVRYHFLDETLWRHPASDTNVISTTPRQEVYLIDLELY